jgi:hypothetical protein
MFLGFSPPGGALEVVTDSSVAVVVVAAVVDWSVAVVVVAAVVDCSVVTASAACASSCILACPPSELAPQRRTVIGREPAV